MAFNPLSIFTGDPGVEAAEKQQAYIQQQNAMIDSARREAQTGGIGALQAGQTGALASYGQGTDIGRGDIIDSTGSAIRALYGGQDLGANALGYGREGGLGYLESGVGQAIRGYRPVSQAAGRYGDVRQQASDMSAAALGLTPGGTANAVAAYQGSPGYQFALNQGLEAIARNANVAGMGASGNMLQDAQKFGTNLAMQDFEKWRQAIAQREQQYAPLELQGLTGAGAGVSQAALTGGTGGANIYTGTAGREAELASTTGRAGADIYGTAGGRLADLASRGGAGEAGVYTGTGQNIANLYGNLFGTQAGYTGSTLKPMGDAYKLAAESELGGAANFWGMAGNLAKGAAGLGWLPTGSFTPTKLG